MEGPREIRLAWGMGSSPSPSRTVRRWVSTPPRPAARDAGVVYRPRRPTATPLYPVVQNHQETFLATAEEADPLGFGVPTWIDHRFRRTRKEMAAARRQQTDREVSSN